MKHKSVFFIVIAILLAVVLVAGGLFYIFKLRIKDNMLDGPGMVYTWTDYELYGDWVAVNTLDGMKSETLSITSNTIVLKYNGSTYTFDYSLPDGIEAYGQPDGEVYLTLEGCDFYESLIFHEEEDESGTFPVLSGTIFEFDGRGEIVITEYVRKDKTDLPEHYESELAKERNNTEAIPTYITVPYSGEEPTAASDNYALICNNECPDDQGQTTLYAFDEEGSELWSVASDYYTMTELTTSSTDMGLQMNGYCFEAGGDLYCVDIETGMLRWKAELVGCPAQEGWAVGPDGTLYIAGFYGPALTVVDIDGHILATYDQFSEDDYHPYIIEYKDGYVEITYESSNRTLIVDPTTGKLKQ